MSKRSTRTGVRPPSLKVKIGAGIAALALLAGVVATVAAPLMGNSVPEANTDITTTTLSDDQYASTVSSLRGLIEGAGADRCQLLNAFEAMNGLPSPTNAAQTSARTRITAELIVAWADSMGPDEASSAELFRQTASDLTAEGEENSFDPSWFLLGPASMTPEFNDAVTSYGETTVAMCQEAPSTTLS